MPDNDLLQLSDYSSKYGVSMSTLRRRIKSGEVDFEFDQGKYWLKDEPIARYVRNRPQATAKKPVTEVSKSDDNKSAQAKTENPPIRRAENAPAPTSEANQIATAEMQSTLNNVQDFTESAKSLMSEIKSAFIKALHEKEEQILELKEEIADLKTLNKILDEENERLKQNSFSEWMESPKAD